MHIYNILCIIITNKHYARFNTKIECKNKIVKYQKLQQLFCNYLAILNKILN